MPALFLPPPRTYEASSRRSNPAPSEAERSETRRIFNGANNDIFSSGSYAQLPKGSFAHLYLPHDQQRVPRKFDAVPPPVLKDGHHLCVDCVDVVAQELRAVLAPLVELLGERGEAAGKWI